MNCIYCNSNGPFNEEHVIPAGIGGDDRRWILSNCVCKKCNTKFSYFEGKVMRESALAIDRLEMQMRSRNRGAKSKPPNINLESCFVYDKKSGLILECDLDIVNNNTTPYPQFFIINESIAFMGPDEKYNELIKKLSKQSIHIIEKTNSSDSNKYFITHIIINEKRYVVKDFFNADKILPTWDTIWLNSLEIPEEYTQYGTNAFPPRIWLKNEQVQFRAHSSDFIIEVLNTIYSAQKEMGIKEPSSKEKRNAQTIAKIDNNGLNISRFYAKISLNIIQKFMAVRMHHYPNLITYVIM